MASGIDHVDAAPNERKRWRAIGAKRTLVGSTVDTERKTRHNNDPRCRKAKAQVPSHVATHARASPSTNDGHPWFAFREAAPAPKKDRGWVDIGSEGIGVLRVAWTRNGDPRSGQGCCNDAIIEPPCFGLPCGKEARRKVRLGPPRPDLRQRLDRDGSVEHCGQSNRAHPLERG